MWGTLSWRSISHGAGVDPSWCWASGGYTLYSHQVAMPKMSLIYIRSLQKSDQSLSFCWFSDHYIFQKWCLKKKKKGQNSSCKLGKYYEQMATKLMEKNMMQQAMQHTGYNINIKRKEKIKLLITRTVIHSQWAFCIQLFISKTSIFVRNELVWCKNTELLQSKVFTHVPVNLVTGAKTKNKKPVSQSGQKRAALSPPDVKQSTLVLVTERMTSLCLKSRDPKSFFNWNRFRVSGYNGVGTCRCYAATLLSFWKTRKRKHWERAFFVARYILRGALNHLPCIQNQRNPGLPCHLWIRLWSQVEHPGVARKNLGSGGALGLHAVAWSLGHGSPLVLGCVSEGYRMSQNSSVFLLPRLASAP